MDYKEKYEMALEKAEGIIKYYKERNRDEAAIEDLQDIFPELKESEDEKIRKALIRYFTLSDEHAYNEACGVSYRDILAWLEKQGGKPTSQFKFKVGDFVKDTNHHKQPIYKIVSIDKECYICESDDVTLGDKAVMHFAFDNPYLRLVEQHKFHVDDWICNSACIVHIASIKDGMYYFDEGDGLDITFVDNNYHLWSITDAKDGDILSYENEVFIVKKSVNLNILYYCCYDGEHFIIDSFYSLTIDDINNIRTATKEQRDQLKKAMVNAGYEWDADKKELKKIESQQAEIQKWSEEDEDNLTDTCVAIRKFYHRNNGAQDLIDWLKSLKERETWKPSDKQIRALRWVLNNIPYNTHKEEISGLLEQIKDL